MSVVSRGTGHEDYSALAYSKPEQAVMLQQDVDIEGFKGGAVGGAQRIVVEYDVPEGKTLMVYTWEFAAETYQSNVSAVLWRYDPTDESWMEIIVGGGAQGFQVVLQKPIRFLSGQTVRVEGEHYSDYRADLITHVGGVLL